MAEEVLYSMILLMMLGEGYMNQSVCKDCPRSCGIDRSCQTGFCGQYNSFRIARAAPHFWEEPAISGTNGSGTIFFSGCNLRCVFCQNAEIAADGLGEEISDTMLAEIMFRLQARGVHNINLVTPSHYIRQLIPVLQSVRQSGLRIPIVWNSSAYESVEMLRRLEGLVDIYLPDLKYLHPETAAKYSRAADYPDVAKAALAEMSAQVGAPQFDPDTGYMTRGVQVRHLVLPGHAQESREILCYLHKTYGAKIGVSIMNQYTPMPKTAADPLLSRRVTPHEYDTVVRYAMQIGMTDALIQEGEAASESFIPPFSGKLLLP